MLWNEPNNKSHWDPEIDPDWSRFAEMIKLAGAAIRRENPELPRALGVLPAFAVLALRVVLSHLWPSLPCRRRHWVRAGR